jgi:predicted permease
MRTLWFDLRYGLRGMSRNPGLTAVAVLSLALGIGANTAIFSFIEALILKALPVQDPKALVLFGPGTSSGNSDGFPNDDMRLFSYSIYRTMQQKCGVFSGVAAISSFDYNEHGTIGDGSALEPIDAQLVSGTYFNVLGVKPAIGRVLTDADDQVLGGHPIAVASYGWWTRRFARNPSVVGKTFRIGETAYTIVGVASPGFQGTTVGHSPNVWIPLQMADAISRGPHKLNDKFYRWLDIIARRRPGVTPAQAQANVNVVLRQILEDYAGPQPSTERKQDILKAHIELQSAATGMSFLRRQFAKPLWMLMGIVGLVLLIACANIANLLLARGTMRRRELAMRLALGAGRSRLVRQLLTEGLALAVMGGAAGLLLAAWAGQFLLRMVSTGQVLIPVDVAPDARVFVFTFLVTLATSLLFSMLPALRATRVQPGAALGEGRSAVAYQVHSPLGKALIVSQVALSLVLLVGAGLFVRSLVNLMNVNTGFNPRNVLEVWVDSSATGYTDDARLTNLYHQVESNVDALPGVEASSFSIFTFNGGAWGEDVWPKGKSGARTSEDNASFNAVGTGYFQTMGLPILAGRGIGPEDTATSPRVAVINQTMARRLFPGESPLGKQFETTGSKPGNEIEVVGVVKDAKYTDLDEEPISMAYFPYTQYEPDWGIGLYLGKFVVRYSGDPRLVVPEVKRAIGAANASMPVERVFTLPEKVANSIVYPRLVAQLSSFFGLLAVFLACVGIYGLMSYTVSRRTNEIGIRMALGAQQAHVLRMVMRETVLLVGIGLAIGIPAALAGGRLVASMLFGLKPADPMTILAALALLLLVAAFAGYLPARRAARVDPMAALRYE